MQPENFERNAMDANAAIDPAILNDLILQAEVRLLQMPEQRGMLFTTSLPAVSLALKQAIALTMQEQGYAFGSKEADALFDMSNLTLAALIACSVGSPDQAEAMMDDLKRLVLDASLEVAARYLKEAQAQGISEAEMLADAQFPEGTPPELAEEVRQAILAKTANTKEN